MEQNPHIPVYEPAVLPSDRNGGGRDTVAPELPDWGSDSYWESDNRISSLLIWLVLFQILCAPAVLLRHLMPATIGFGQFSFATDYRYLYGAFTAASLALLVLIPFLFAWSTRSVSWRLTACIPVAFLVCVLNFAMVFLDVLVFKAARMPVLNFFREIGPYVSAVAFAIVGIATVPLAIRAWLGWCVSKVSSNQSFGRSERMMDWIILTGTTLIVFVVGPLAFSSQSGMLPGAFGLAVGAIVSIPAFWLLREQSSLSLRIAFSVYLSLFVLLPGCCVWFADYSSIPILPRGSGIYFVGLISFAMVLLCHLILFRRMGYRMQKPVSKKVVSPIEKAVVDPFSD